MSDATRPPVLPRPPDAATYQPLSAVAVAAIGVAALSAVLLVALVIAARMSGRPAVSTFVFPLALLSVTLAVAARWQIRRSEGARAGLKLANAAWWLGILCAGGYGAFYIATEWAVRRQAEEFTLEWFEKIKTGPPEAAFLYIMDPVQRRKIDGKDVQGIRGRFQRVIDAFRDSEINRLCQRSGNAAIVRPEGIKSWSHTDAGFEVHENVTLRMPDGEFGLIVAVIGTDNPELKGRQWQVKFADTGVVSKAYTRLGRMQYEIEAEGFKYLQDWTRKIDAEKLRDAYLDTLSALERQQVGDDPNPPKLADFRQGNFIKLEGQTPPADKQKEIANDILKPNMISLFTGSAMSSGIPPVLEYSAGGVQVAYAVEVRGASGQSVPATITVEVLGDELLAEMKRLRGPGWDQEPVGIPPADGKPELSRFQRSFRVKEVNVRPSAVRPGPPGAPSP